MAINTEVFDSLWREGFYDKYPYLYIADRPDEHEIELLKSRLKKIGKDHLLTPNSVFVFGRSSRDLPFESEFNVLFTHENPSKGIDVNAILRYANEHPNYESRVVPKGHTGVICLIEFNGEVPKAINALSVYGKQKWDSTKTIYLSQRPVLDRIIELMSLSQV